FHFSCHFESCGKKWAPGQKGCRLPDVRTQNYIERKSDFKKRKMFPFFENIEVLEDQWLILGLKVKFHVLLVE
ncbi:MAG: hypothetical protein IKS22_00830, partial [Bacteroidales bacterium]|nr:hypothetical protein [Bacteroidales bacterium]